MLYFTTNIGSEGAVKQGSQAQCRQKTEFAVA